MSSQLRSSGRRDSFMLVNHDKRMHGGSGTVADLVLLSDITESAIATTLGARWEDDDMYTFIGDVLVSVNPYKTLPIFAETVSKTYRGKNFYEMPPHVYAIADETHRDMLEHHRNQCIIICGESGSGKTEASKRIMEYIALVAGNTKEVNRVKEQLLKSNPVLESFGNAKTLRNDNSSRFGKYMDMEFDFRGNPIGGLITNYLLEKSRVVKRMEGERNFHIFYELLAGTSDGAIAFCELTRDPRQFRFLGNCTTVRTINDKEKWEETKAGLDVIGFNGGEMSIIFSLLGAILHIGNIEFRFDEDNDTTAVSNAQPLQSAAKLLKMTVDALEKALTTNTIQTFGETVSAPLDAAKSNFARCALAKAIYERMFSWIVRRINDKIKITRDETQRHELETDLCVIGVLDIYGFEIFELNGFEQFIINYCNEKLQQLFIELTIKAEQDDYIRQGVEWTQVDYINNVYICELLERPRTGILAILDEECLRPGQTSDLTFLASLNERVVHQNFETWERTHDQSLSREAFRIKHYAGEVDYTVSNFLETNRDTLFFNVRSAMYNSGHPLVRLLFPDGANDSEKLKRPPTAAYQFKQSMTALVSNLMSKQPHYIRCIKPNESKSSKHFDKDLVLNQIRYLGLLENVIVRRSGYAYRQTYDYFFTRYCMLSTYFPKWQTAPSTLDGTISIVTSLLPMKDPETGESAYCFGGTKIFLRHPRSVFHLEELRRDKIVDLIEKIQACWRGYRRRKLFLAMRKAQIIISKRVKGYLLHKRYKRMKIDVVIVQARVRGFIVRRKYRKQLNGWCGPVILAFMRRLKVVLFLQRMARELPSNSPIDHRWVTNAPKDLSETSALLKTIHHRLRCQKYAAVRVRVYPIIERFMIRAQMTSYLLRLSKTLPSNSPIDKTWPKPPTNLRKLSNGIQWMHHKWRCARYRYPRLKAAPIWQRAFRRYQIMKWFLRLAKYLHTNQDEAYMPLRNQLWARVPKNHQETNKIIRHIFHLWRCKLYRDELTPTRKNLLEEKLWASENFKGKKNAYPISLPRMFVPDRAGLYDGPLRGRWDALCEKLDLRVRVICSQNVRKVHRRSGKVVPMVLALTPKEIIMATVNEKAMGLKYELSYNDIEGMSTSKIYDRTVVLHLRDAAKSDPKVLKKGDFIFDCEFPIEFMSKLALAMRRKNETELGVRLNNDINLRVFGQNMRVSIQTTGEPSIQDCEYAKSSSSELVCYLPLAMKFEATGSS